MLQVLAQRQKHKLLLASQLQQASHILQLPLTELKNLINKELENNPCLEACGSQFFSWIDDSSHIIPDIIIDNNAGRYRVSVNDKGLPVLRINNFYKSLLNRRNIANEEKKSIRQRLHVGQNFIKNIQARKEIIKRLAEYVVRSQEEFLEKGREYIRTVTIKQAAEEIQDDESMVSRAVNNKYFDTPQGILRVKDLFSD